MHGAKPAETHAFVAAVELKSFTKAAKQLGLLAAARERNGPESRAAALGRPGQSRTTRSVALNCSR